MESQTNLVELARWHFGPVGKVHDWMLHTESHGSYGLLWVGPPESRVAVRFGQDWLLTCTIWQAVLGVVVVVLFLVITMRRLGVRCREGRDENG